MLSMRSRSRGSRRIGGGAKRTGAATWARCGSCGTSATVHTEGETPNLSTCHNVWGHGSALTADPETGPCKYGSVWT